MENDTTPTLPPLRKIAFNKSCKPSRRNNWISYRAGWPGYAFEHDKHPGREFVVARDAATNTGEPIDSWICYVLEPPLDGETLPMGWVAFRKHPFRSRRVWALADSMSILNATTPEDLDERIFDRKLVYAAAALGQ